MEDIFETVVCQATNVAPGNSEAAILRYNDGRLLLAYTYFYAGEASNVSLARISAKISEDQGNIWGKRFPLQEAIDGINVTTPSFLRLKSGEAALFFLHKSRRDICLPYLTRSRDEGRTWSKPSALLREERLFDMANNSVIQLSNGRILAPMCRFSRRVESYFAFCSYSDDGGGSWRKGENEVELSKNGAMDPHVVELKNGDVLMSIRNQLGRVYYAYSKDKGSTWRNVDSTEILSSDSPTLIRRIPNTRDLLMVWNNGREKRSPLTTAISSDEGESWENYKNLESGVGMEYSHACISFIDGNALIIYNLYDANTRWISLKLKKVPVKWFYQ